MTSTPPPPVNVAAVARAIRFALVCILLGLCFLNLRCALSINGFGLIYRDTYRDLLGGHPLPALTAFVFQSRILLTSLSVIVPFCAVLILFSRELVRSFYALGLLFLLTFTELVILYYALFSPLALIIREVGRNLSQYGK